MPIRTKDQARLEIDSMEELLPEIFSEITPLTAMDHVRLTVYRRPLPEPERKKRGRGKEPTDKRKRILDYLGSNPEEMNSYNCAGKLEKSKIISRICYRVLNQKPRAITDSDRKFVANLIRERSRVKTQG
jgi:hypothetical protein